MRFAASLTALVAVVLIAGTGFANIPDPSMSSFANRLGRSPHNQGVAPGFVYTYSGQLLNAVGQPVNNFDRTRIVLTILAPCQNPASFNPDANSDANGNVVWGVATSDAMGGGSCLGSVPAPVAEIKVDNVVFKTHLMVTSPDEDGVGGNAGLQDFVTLVAAFQTGSPIYQGDLNLDGSIGLTDVTFFQRHFTAPF